MMGGEEGLYYAGDGIPGPDDLGLAWDAAERYASYAAPGSPSGSTGRAGTRRGTRRGGRTFQVRGAQVAVPATGPRGMGPAAAQAVTG